MDNRQEPKFSLSCLGIEGWGLRRRAYLKTSRRPSVQHVMLSGREQEIGLIRGNSVRGQLWSRHEDKVAFPIMSLVLQVCGQGDISEPMAGPLEWWGYSVPVAYPARKAESGENGDQGLRGSFMASVVELCGSWQAGEQGSLDAAVATASLEDCAPQPSWYNRCGESIKLDALGVEKGQVGPWK